MGGNSGKKQVINWQKLSRLERSESRNIYDLRYVPGFQNVGNHGKGMSDGVGAVTKRAWDRGSLGVDPKIDAGSSHADWGGSLVQFGNVRLSKAAVGQAGRLLFRCFYTFAAADWECLVQVPGKFPIQRDGMGVKRGITTLFCFMYMSNAKHMTFRNMVCGCEACLLYNFTACSNKKYVAPPVV